MNKFIITVFIMMEMCITFRARISDMFSISEKKHCTA